MVIFALLLLLLPSCGDRVACDLLERAQSLIERDSCESALALLDSIDRESLPGGEPQALHALLLSQACDKCYIDVENDSLIAIAVDYYSNSGDTRKNMLAHYYLGRVRFNAKDYPRCIIAMIKALELARELDDKFWMGMSARGVSDVYHATYNSAEELEYAKIEYDNFKASGRQPYINYAALDMARSSFNANDYPQGFKILSQLNDSANKHNDNTLTAEIHRLIGSAYVSSKEYDKAKSHLKALCDSGMANRDDSILLGLALVYRGETMAAKGILQATYDMADISSNFLEYNVYTSLNNDSIALAALERVDSATNAAFESRINQGISHSVIDFYALNNEVNKAKALTMRSYIWLVTVSCVLVIVVLGVSAYNFHRRQRERIEKNILFAEQLKDTILKKETEYNEAQHSIKLLLSTKYEMFDKLCRMMYESQNTVKTRAKISETVEAFIKQMARSPKKMAELEGFINDYHCNLFKNFREDLPALKDSEYKLFLFSILGFSSTAISVLCGEDKVTAIYDRKRHLKDKIKKLEDSKKDLYLQYL